MTPIQQALAWCDGQLNEIDAQPHFGPIQRVLEREPYLRFKRMLNSLKSHEIEYLTDVTRLAWKDSNYNTLNHVNQMTKLPLQEEREVSYGIWNEQYITNIDHLKSLINTKTDEN